MDFQTPDWVCKIMVDMVDFEPFSILEPTPGEGNLVKAIQERFPSTRLETPTDFWALPDDIKIDIIIANPPFSPMTLGYQMLDRFALLSKNWLYGTD